MKSNKNNLPIVLENGHKSVSRIITVTHRVLKQFLRDRQTFAMILIIPLLVMIVFGFSLSGEFKNLPILIENADQGYPPDALPEDQWFNYGTNITEQLKQDETIDYHEGTYNTSLADVDNGKYYAAIYIPNNFSESLYRRIVYNHNITIVVTIYIDATNPTVRMSIMNALGNSLQESLGADWIVVHETFAHGGEEYSGLDTSIPGVMAFVLTYLVLLISTLTMIREKLVGTENRLFATPLRSSEKICGYSLALLVIAVLTSIVILIVGLGIFGTTLRGSFFLLIVAIVMYSLLHVLIAVFVSNFAENELQAVQMAPIITLPSMAVSGFLIPISSLPKYLQPFSKIFPLYYGTRLLEGIMLKGWGFSQLWLDFLVLFGMMILFSILAMLTVKNTMTE